VNYVDDKESSRVTSANSDAGGGVSIPALAWDDPMRVFRATGDDVASCYYSDASIVLLF
jgi:hypothetical protein